MRLPFWHLEVLSNGLSHMVDVGDLFDIWPPCSSGCLNQTGFNGLRLLALAIVECELLSGGVAVRDEVRACPVMEVILAKIRLGLIILGRLRRGCRRPVFG